MLKGKLNAMCAGGHAASLLRRLRGQGSELQKVILARICAAGGSAHWWGGATVEKMPPGVVGGWVVGLAFWRSDGLKAATAVATRG